MKNFYYFYMLLFASFFLASCSEDDNDLVDVNTPPPTNISAEFTVTQDNTGLVTITPLGENVTAFQIQLGDGSELITGINPGDQIEHTYEEGSYEVGITGFGLDGDSESVTQTLVVSFNPPENVEVTIENDGTVSKQVNVTTTADFAVYYEVDFGEDEEAEVVTGNIGETVSYQYEEEGVYTITVEVFGGATETTVYTEEFEVTAIEQPIASAPSPPARNPENVISFFTTTYTNEEGTDFFPDWGQGGCCGSSWSMFNLNGDEMLQYSNLSYQGNQFAQAYDFSTMENVHFDFWTADVLEAVDVFLISQTNGERKVTVELTPNGWTSIDIPISEFTDQDGFTVADIHQIKYEGIPFGGGGDLFVDNIYAWKQPAAGGGSLMIEDFEGTAPTFTNFGGAETQVVANPDQSGQNTTATTAQLTKANGAEVWAGSFFTEEAPLDLDNYQSISVKTWSPTVGGIVKLKLENADASIVHEVDLTSTVANEWEELVYDFSAAPEADYVNVVMFFDFGNMGDGSVYYFDEIQLQSNSTGPAPLPFQNFEATAPVFTNFGGVDTQVVTNPDQSGENTTANVAQQTKPNGAETWAGSFFELSAPLDLDNYSKIAIKTWSPIAGVIVKAKLENADASIVHEVDLTSTVANEWEDLVYDFSAAPEADYNRVVMFFDFGNAGDGSVYYYDEYRLTN